MTRREAVGSGVSHFKGEDTIIGSCAFISFDPGFHYAETGYELHRAYWRQGIMAEALASYPDLWVYRAWLASY